MKPFAHPIALAASAPSTDVYKRQVHIASSAENTFGGDNLGVAVHNLYGLHGTVPHALIAVFTIGFLKLYTITFHT